MGEFSLRCRRGVRYMDMVMFHGHGTRRSLRKHKHACNISSLLISLSDFFYKLVVEGLLSRHSGFISRCLFHIVVHSFLCGLFAPACAAMALLSRLTAHIARLTTPVSLLTAPSPCWLLLAGREIRGSWPGPCGFLGGSSRGVIMGPRGPRAIVACGRTMLKSSTPRCTAVLWSGLASRLLTGAGRVAPPRPRTGPRRPAGAPRGVARVSAHCCLRAGGGRSIRTIRD